MSRSIPPDCVVRRLHSLLFALLTPCHAGGSTPEECKLISERTLNIDNPYVWYDITPEVAGTWHYTMKNYAQYTAATSPNYRYYIGAGTVHTILMSSKFYTEDSAGGKSFVEWVKEMIKTPNKWESVGDENFLP